MEPTIAALLYVAAGALFYGWAMITAQPEPGSEWTPKRLKLIAH